MVSKLLGKGTGATAGRIFGAAVGCHIGFSGEATMAIKRAAKGRGTLSHKPFASAPLRHIDVRVPRQMQPGELYVGWLCKKCGLVIAIAATAPGAKAQTEFEDPLNAIKCPHCGDEDLYRRNARSELKYTPKGLGP
jgi:predicted RNA-binding Zn-ribbon protein involved in translation (DUF1610 family)